MRTFHTHNHSGLELKGDTVSIGRGSSHPLLHAGKLVKHGPSSVPGEKNRPFYCQSKWSIMLKNLNHGLEFMERQNSNLNEMDKTLSHWRNSLPSDRVSGGKSFSPETFLCLQTILGLSEEKLFNHTLFGCGFESPIRIHLNLKGERSVQEIPVVPLLNQPGFCALAHSGRSSRRPSVGLFDRCEMEFVNALLVVNRNLEGLRRQLRSIEESQPMGALGNPLPRNPKRESPSPGSSGFNRFMDWVNRCIKPWKATPVYHA
jgi:hypothetical protein